MTQGSSVSFSEVRTVEQRPENETEVTMIMSERK